MLFPAVKARAQFSCLDGSEILNYLLGEGKRQAEPLSSPARIRVRDLGFNKERFEWICPRVAPENSPSGGGARCARRGPFLQKGRGLASGTLPRQSQPALGSERASLAGQPRKLLWQRPCWQQIGFYFFVVRTWSADCYRGASVLHRAMGSRYFGRWCDVGYSPSGLSHNWYFRSAPFAFGDRSNPW